MVVGGKRWLGGGDVVALGGKGVLRWWKQVQWRCKRSLSWCTRTMFAGSHAMRGCKGVVGRCERPLRGVE